METVICGQGGNDPPRHRLGGAHLSTGRTLFIFEINVTGISAAGPLDDTGFRFPALVVFAVSDNTIRARVDELRHVKALIDRVDAEGFACRDDTLRGLALPLPIIVVVRQPNLNEDVVPVWFVLHFDDEENILSAGVGLFDQRITADKQVFPFRGDFDRCLVGEINGKERVGVRGCLFRHCFSVC